MIWEQQQQLLQDFEVVAELAQPGKNDGSAAFQSMMCYVNAFGTSGNMTKATKFLSMAEEAGHLVARVMGPRMLDGFTNSSACLQRTYSESLALGFSITRKPQIPPKVFIFRDSSMTEYLDYEVFREKALRGELGNDMNVITGERPNIGSSVRPHALELAIQHGDLELVKALLQDIDNEAALVIEGELLVIQAASRGHGAIVIELLKAGAPIARQNSSSLLHWLFCLDRSNLTEVQLLLQKSSGEFPLETWLNEASTEKITVHPQWPFQIHGTPLATAIAAGNSAAINVLLSLGADPLAQAFAVNEGDESPVLTPIHLAVRYHLPEILQLLWQTAFGEKEISGMKLYQAQALGSSPIACALSLMTNAERFAIHGSAYKEALQNTIQQLSPDILLQSSTEGKNALIQAIDLEDLGTVELLLVHCPMLASRKLQHANSKGMFTYPLHFAVQVGSSRDTEESVQILDRILELDPTAIRRFDSSSVKPLHIAAMGSSARITDFLLNLGASCQDLDWHGKSPLHFSGTAANAKLLLASGADIDHKDNLGFTAAHKAAEKGTEDILQALIDAGANLTSTDSEIGSPLHCAIQRKSRTMAEMLLKAGVDINAQNKTGKTPLLLAMDTGHLDLVIFLFENGAHPFIEDNSGSSPFLMSLAWKNPNILSTFEAHDAFEELSWEAKLKALHFAAKSGEPAPLEQFLRRLPKPPVQIYDCEYPGMVSALHESAASCRVDLLDVLISAGFEVDCRDAIGNTPLNLACQAGRNKSDSQMHARINTCKYLIESGADILSKHNGGLTAFKIARAHCDYPLMTLFLEHALERNGLDEQKRQSRILESIKDPSKEDRFCKEARAFIGYEVFAMKLIQDAVLKEEWEFIMACIGGCFVVKQIFHLRPLSARVDWGMTGWDMLRYYSVLRDRDMVRRVALGSGESESQRTWDVGRRNLEAEYLETKGSIDELLWPGQRKRYSYLDRAILRGPHRDPDASETISNGSKVMHNWSMMKKQKALNFEEIAEHGIEFAEFYVRDYVGTVEFLFEGMQKWRAKRNEIRDHGDNMGDLEWAREILEEVEGTLMYPAEGLPVLMTYCSTQQFTTRGWNSIYQTGKAASESLKVLTKDLKKAFEDVDETMERMRGNQ
jgi:ankyrin repeat protein